ncbi:hypothetical protein [Palaeococcus sp. (in: euryarchaeotes)]
MTFKQTYFTDLGRKKALQNEFLIIPEEIKKNQDLLKEVFKFILEEIPLEIRNNTPLTLTACRTGTLSPYPLEVRCLLDTCPDIPFHSRDDVIEHLNIDLVTKIFRDTKVELIGIDESRVEMPLQGSAYAYLKSVAFRISRTPEGQEEYLGPIVRDFKVDFREDAYFEKRNQFWGYLRNLFVAKVVIERSVNRGFKPIVFMHGPLVRAIGGFTDIFLKKEEAVRVLSLDLGSAEELGPDSYEGDIISRNEYGEELLRKLHEEEAENIERIYGSIIARLEDSGSETKLSGLWYKALPMNLKTGAIIDFADRKYYPGITIYFWLLRELYDLCKENEIPLVAVVENIERATEFVQYVLPPLLLKSYTSDEYYDLPKNIKSIFDKHAAHGVPFDAIVDRIRSRRLERDKRDFYQYIFRMIKMLNITDSVITTNLLNEGEYTIPIQTYRYVTREIFQDKLGHGEYGIYNDYRSILQYYFDPEEKRILFSYLRTTPLREPIRIEFFDIYPNYTPIVGATYLLSLFYPNYGLPIILYYTDKVARTHTNYLRQILEYVLVDILSGEFRTEDMLRIFKALSRNFWERG